MTNSTDFQISERFTSGRCNVEDLIAPLIDLTHESSSLVLGYGMPQAGVREKMIPYFHVCGTYTDVEPLRVLIVGGWTGTESATPYAIARLLAAMEARLSLVAGLEITAYPVANLEAHREGVFLTEKQQLESVRCWENSSCSHIRVMENELRRYDYDAVMLLRENPNTTETEVEAWVPQERQHAVIKAALERHAASGEPVRWSANSESPGYARTFTPIPHSAVQPAEIIIGLPGRREATERASEALGLMLALLHALREARQQNQL
jgi:hypothetical protein